MKTTWATPGRGGSKALFNSLFKIKQEFKPFAESCSHSHRSTDLLSHQACLTCSGDIPVQAPSQDELGSYSWKKLQGKFPGGIFLIPFLSTTPSNRGLYTVQCPENWRVPFVTAHLFQKNSFLLPVADFHMPFHPFGMFSQGGWLLWMLGRGWKSPPDPHLYTHTHIPSSLWDCANSRSQICHWKQHFQLGNLLMQKNAVYHWL